MNKIINQKINLPKGTKSTGMAAVAVYLVSLEIKKNLSENSIKSFDDGKYVQLNVANVHSKTFEYRIGKDYRKSIEEAINNGDLKIFTKNGIESYRNGKDAFTKGYSLSDELYNNLKRFDFVDKEILIKLKRNYKNRKKIVEKKEKNVMSNYAEKLEENYKELFFSENLYDQPFYDYFDVTNNKIVEKVNTKSVELKDYDQKDRFYHPVILMNREYRKFLRSEKDVLTIIDASSLNPFLLGKFILDPSEKIKWLKLCGSGEFYTKIAGVDKSHKEHYKKIFQVAMSGKTFRGSLLKEYINNLRVNFPSLMNAVDRINSSGKTVAGVLQKLENKIFRNDLIKNKSEFHLPMHDGLLCYKNDADSFVKLLETISYDVLGYKLIFTVEELSDKRAETTQKLVQEEQQCIDPKEEEKPVESEKKVVYKNVTITEKDKLPALQKIHKFLNELRTKISKENDSFEKNLLIDKQRELLILVDKIKKTF